MQRVTLKRGATFEAYVLVEDGGPLDLTGHTVTSDVRNKVGELVAALDVTVEDQLTDTGYFVVSSPSTSTWPLGIHLWDYRILSPSLVELYSATIEVEVIREVTH